MKKISNKIFAGVLILAAAIMITVLIILKVWTTGI